MGGGKEEPAGVVSLSCTREVIMMMKSTMVVSPGPEGVHGK